MPFHKLLVALRAIVALIEGCEPRVLDPIVSFRRHGERFMVERAEDIIESWPKRPVAVTIIDGMIGC
jgi:hypothetical protein